MNLSDTAPFSRFDPCPQILVVHLASQGRHQPVTTRVAAWNPAAEALLEAGTGPEALSALFPVNHLALVSACLDQRRAIEDVECRIRDRVLLWSYLPAAEGSEVLIRGRDATHDVRTREEATRSNRLYRLITENTTDLISRHAPDGRFIDATPASWRLLGYWPEELRGKRLQDIFGDTDATARLAETGSQLVEKGYATLTLQIRHRDGSKRWFEIASRAIRETYTGAVIEIISVSRDISARIASEEHNRELAAELAQASRLATLGELASSIAHEMNQPLATIVNFASASQRYLAQASQQPVMLDRVDEGLGRIIEHANRASEVIRRLRAFLRKGQQRLAPAPLNQVVTDALRLCQWEAEKQGVALKPDLTPDNPVVTVDPVLMEQVLVNLIRNGVDANLERAQDTPSELRLETAALPDGSALIRVTDQGPGLSEEGLRQMFQPFYTSKPQGLGLGLSMSRSIVEGFGGFLDAEAAQTGGLTLICRFPPKTGATAPPIPDASGDPTP